MLLESQENNMSINRFKRNLSKLKSDLRFILNGRILKDLFVQISLDDSFKSGDNSQEEEKNIELKNTNFNQQKLCIFIFFQ